MQSELEGNRTARTKKSIPPWCAHTAQLGRRRVTEPNYTGLGVSQADVLKLMRAAGVRLVPSNNGGSGINRYAYWDGAYPPSVLSIMGPVHDIREVGVSTPVSQTDDEMNDASATVIFGLLNLVFPNWDGTNDWLVDRIARDVEEGAQVRRHATITYKNQIADYGDLELVIEVNE